MKGAEQYLKIRLLTSLSLEMKKIHLMIRMTLTTFTQGKYYSNVFVDIIHPNKYLIFKNFDILIIIYF